MAYHTRYPYNNVESAKSTQEIRTWQEGHGELQGIFNIYMDTVLAEAKEGYGNLQAQPNGPEKTAALKRFDDSMQVLLQNFREFAGTEDLNSQDGNVTGYFTPGRLHARILGTPGLVQGLNIPAGDLEPALPGDTDVGHQNISKFVGDPPYLNIINNTMAKLEGTSPTKQLVFDVPEKKDELYQRMEAATVKPLVMPEDPGIPKPWREAWEEQITNLKQFGNLGPDALHELETLLQTQKPYQELERGVPVAPVNAELITERLGMLDIEDMKRRCPSLQNNPDELLKVQEIQRLAFNLYNAKDSNDRLDPNDPKDMERMVGSEFQKLQTDPKYKKGWLGEDNPQQFVKDTDRLRDLLGGPEGSTAMKEYLAFMVVVTNPNTPEVNIAMVPPDVLTQSVDVVVKRALDQQPKIDMPVPAPTAAIMGVVPQTPDEMAAFVKSLERRDGQFTLELPAAVQRPAREPDQPTQTAALSPTSGAAIGMLRGDDPKQALTFLAFANTDGHPELEPMKQLAQQTLGMLKDSQDLSKLPAELANKALQAPFRENMAELQQLIGSNQGALNGLTSSVMLPEGQKLGDMLSRAAEKGMALGEGKRAELDSPDARHDAWKQATLDVRDQIKGSTLVAVSSMQQPKPLGVVVADNTQEAAVVRLN